MTCVIHKISVGAGGKHTFELSPEESLRRSVSFGKLRSQYGRSHANMRAITAAKTIKNAYSNSQA